MPEEREDAAVREALSNAGFGLLFIAAVMLGFMFLWLSITILDYVPGFIGGGIVGVLVALLVPPRPARVGSRFGGAPREPSPFELELQAHVIRLRKRWLMVAANVPYLAGLAIYGLAFDRSLPSADVGNMIVGGFFSMLVTAALALAVQYLQVLWDLRREVPEPHS